MASPVASTRGTPSGRRIPEGFSSKVSIAGYTTISFWEVESPPPGIEGGEPIDITTQFNTVVKQKWPRRLIEYPGTTVRAAYNPNVITTIRTIINQVLSFTWLYPNGATDTYWAWLRSFKPTGLKIGEFPLADITIEIANTDPASGANLAEAGPVFVAGS